MIEALVVALWLACVPMAGLLAYLGIEARGYGKPSGADWWLVIGEALLGPAGILALSLGREADAGSASRPLVRLLAAVWCGAVVIGFWTVALETLVPDDWRQIVLFGAMGGVGGWIAGQVWTAPRRDALKNAQAPLSSAAFAAQMAAQKMVPTRTGTFGQQAATFGTIMSSILDEASDVADVEEMWTPEPVIGWRAWELDISELILRGALGNAWIGPSMHATHDRGRGHWVGVTHDSPHPDCLCGINAVHAPYHMHLPTPAFTVIGRVALTGVIDEYEIGYRASDGEIIDLTIIGDVGFGDCVLDALELRYGTRPRVQSLETWLIEQEEQHGPGQADTPDHLGAGEGAGSRAGEREGTGQAVIIEHTGSCCLSGPVVRGAIGSYARIGSGGNVVIGTPDNPYGVGS